MTVHGITCYTVGCWDFMGFAGTFGTRDEKVPRCSKVFWWVEKLSPRKESNSGHKIVQDYQPSTIFTHASNFFPQLTPATSSKIIHHIPWRIHGAGIYANMTGVYGWDPRHTIYSSTGRIRHGYLPIFPSPPRLRTSPGRLPIRPRLFLHRGRGHRWAGRSAELGGHAGRCHWLMGENASENEGESHIIWITYNHWHSLTLAGVPYSCCIYSWHFTTGFYREMGNEVAERGMINDQQKWLVKQQTRGNWTSKQNWGSTARILSKDNMILKCHFSTRSGVDQQASIHVLFGTVYGLRFKGLPVGNQMGWSSPTCNWQVVICTFSFCHDLPCVNIYIYI